LAALLEKHSEIRHFRIEDGPGLPLGRSFAVKLWPTFVFLRDGEVTARLVRPSTSELAAAFDSR
jgi:thioredoxin 1